MSQDKNTGPQTTSMIIEAARKTVSSSLVQNSTSVPPKNPNITDSDHSSKDTRDSPKQSLETRRKDHGDSHNQLRVGHEEKSQKSRIDKEVVTTGTVGVKTISQESDAAHVSGSGALHNTDSIVKHDAQSDAIQDSGSGSGSGRLQDESEVKSGAAADSKIGSTDKEKGGRVHGTETSVTHGLKDSFSRRQGSDVTQKPKDVVIFGPQSDVKHVHENVSANPSQDINTSTERPSHAPESHKPSRQLKVSSSRSPIKPSHAQLDNSQQHNIAHTSDGKNGNLSPNLFLLLL